MKYKRVDPALRAQKRAEWNQPVIWPLYALAGLITIIVLPGIMTYRRKERQPPPTGMIGV
jgi:hypothetical protein